MEPLTEADKATLDIMADLFFEVIKNQIANQIK